MNLPMFNMKAEIADTQLSARFGVPPFSVLDARQGYWQERKRAWLALGIKSELGRGDVMPSGANSAYSGASEWAGKRGPARTFGQDMAAGTSIFDPVLCELAYRWFAPAGGKILDPYAGGSVRGIVAAYTGHHYTGLDLRQEQVLANREQWAEIKERITPLGSARWGCADSRKIAELIPEKFDLIFTCPPYFDLEQYSQDPTDLSNAADYAAFLDSYSHIWQQCISMLNPNRFAVVVVGDIRDKQGFYRGLVGDTIEAFADEDMGLYNEGILITSVGSLPLRVGKQFGSYRKLGKSHQQVLVFYKGDIKAIPAEFGEIEMRDFWSAE